jgi:hypothetical protein
MGVEAGEFGSSNSAAVPGFA